MNYLFIDVCSMKIGDNLFCNVEVFCTKETSEVVHVELQAQILQLY